MQKTRVKEFADAILSVVDRFHNKEIPWSRFYAENKWLWDRARDEGLHVEVERLLRLTALREIEREQTR